MSIIGVKPIPIDVFEDISNRKIISSYNSKLDKKSGIYGINNKLNGKCYIGSSRNLYDRLVRHFNNNGSNKALQDAFIKYGLQNFSFVVYVYAPYTLPQILDLETLYISYFPFEDLYNFKRIANSMLGYKHTSQAIQKMKDRFLDSINHPMFGKNHTVESKKLISKPGNKNPMFGKVHKIETKQAISKNRSLPVSLYDSENNYVLTFKNGLVLSKFLNCSNVTISKYIKTGKLYNKN